MTKGGCVTFTEFVAYRLLRCSIPGLSTNHIPVALPPLPTSLRHDWHGPDRVAEFEDSEIGG